MAELSWMLENNINLHDWRLVLNVVSQVLNCHEFAFVWLPECLIISIS